MVTDNVNYHHLLPDNYIKDTLYWSAGVNEFEVPESQASNLKIAVIVGEKLYSGLKYEAELVLLKENNWENILSHTKVDFLLVESCRFSVSGEWYLASSFNNELNSTLENLIDVARNCNIPTVFWNTQDIVYFEHYISLAHHFDFVFCADPKTKQAYDEKGISASLLLPAVQPKIFNKFNDYRFLRRWDFGLIYDGWSDLLRFPELEESLVNLKKNNLKIIESVSSIYKTKVAGSGSVKDCILGCVDQRSRAQALKYTPYELFLDITLKTPLSISWMVLESVASRVIPFWVSEKQSDQSIIQAFCDSVANLNELTQKLQHYENDPTYKQQLVQEKWRNVLENFSFAKRIEEICEKLNIDFDNSKEMVTVITPTNRLHTIDRVIENFKIQSYPNKELIIVFNGQYDEYLSIDQSQFRLSNLSFIYQPNDLYAGASLNNAIFQAKGNYCFRMDDDDYYGENYLTDMMLNAKTVDADIFGKPPSYIYFEEGRELYERSRIVPTLTRLPFKQVAEGKLRLGGNSIAGKTQALKNNTYIDNAFASADSAFLTKAGQNKLEVYTFDNYGLVASRSIDPKAHTWQITKKAVLRNAEKLAQKKIADICGKYYQPKTQNKKKNVLFIGPGGFREGVWQNRARYILPDLFEAISKDANIFMLTGKVPRFAKPTLNELIQQFGLTHKQLPPARGKNKQKHWIDSSIAYAQEIHADIVTNIFGSVQFPYYVVKTAQALNVHSVIRLAGDEITSRLAMGSYEKNSKEHEKDLLIEKETLNKSDQIIVMSEREKHRVEAITSNENIDVVIRGIDLNQFNPVRVGQFSSIKSLRPTRKCRQKYLPKKQRVKICICRRF